MGLESRSAPVMSSLPGGAPALNIPLLDRLRAAGGDYVPLAELGASLALVRSDLEALASFGFGVEEHPYRGAAYRGSARRLCPDQIEHDLATTTIGRRIAVWNRVASTNDLAARAGKSPSNDGLVVLAEEQTDGRGRRGRSWVAPPCSSILMSTLLFPPADLTPALAEAAFGCAWLTILGAVAVAEVVTAWTRREATIKWPNDVRIEGRKIAGILVERVLAPSLATPSGVRCTGSAVAHGAVIGIGINVNLDRQTIPNELAGCATSMQIEAGTPGFDRSEVVRSLIRRLDYWYEASRVHGVEILNDPWRSRSEHLGRMVRIAAAGGRSIHGRLADLDLRHGIILSEPAAASREPIAEGSLPAARIPIADILTLENAP